jgi:uncharacterized membrane protein
VSYESVIADSAKVVEAVGAGLMVIGGLGVFVVGGIRALDPAQRPQAYGLLRRHLGRVILLGLEVLIIGDIVRTIIVDPTLTSVAVLAAIVVIRIVLSFSLEVEIDGAWPWSRRRLARGGGEDVTPMAEDADRSL